MSKGAEGTISTQEALRRDAGNPESLGAAAAGNPTKKSIEELVAATGGAAAEKGVPAALASPMEGGAEAQGMSPAADFVPQTQEDATPAAGEASLLDAALPSADEEARRARLELALSRAQRAEEEARASRARWFGNMELRGFADRHEDGQALNEHDVRRVLSAYASSRGMKKFRTDSAWLEAQTGEKTPEAAAKAIIQHHKTLNKEARAMQSVLRGTGIAGPADADEQEDRVAAANWIFYGEDKVRYRDAFSEAEIAQAYRLADKREKLFEAVAQGASDSAVRAASVLAMDNVPSDAKEKILRELGNEQEQDEALMLAGTMRAQSDGVYALELLESLVRGAKRGTLAVPETISDMMREDAEKESSNAYKRLRRLAREQGARPGEELQFFEKLADEEFAKAVPGFAKEREKFKEWFGSARKEHMKQRSESLAKTLEQRVKRWDESLVREGSLGAAESFGAIAPALGASAAIGAIGGALAPATSGTSAAAGVALATNILKVAASSAIFFSQGYQEAMERAAMEDWSSSDEDVETTAMLYGAWFSALNMGTLSLAGGSLRKAVGGAIGSKSLSQTLASEQARSASYRFAQGLVRGGREFPLNVAAEGVEEGMEAVGMNIIGMMMDIRGAGGEAAFTPEGMAEEFWENTVEGWKVAPFMMLPLMGGANVRDVLRRDFVSYDGKKRNVLGAEQSLINARAKIEAQMEARRQGIAARDVLSIPVNASYDARQAFYREQGWSKAQRNAAERYVEYSQILSNYEATANEADGRGLGEAIKEADASSAAQTEEAAAEEAVAAAETAEDEVSAEAKALFSDEDLADDKDGAKANVKLALVRERIAKLAAKKDSITEEETAELERLRDRRDELGDRIDAIRATSDEPVREAKKGEASSRVFSIETQDKLREHKKLRDAAKAAEVLSDMDEGTRGMFDLSNEADIAMSALADYEAARAQDGHLERADYFREHPIEGGVVRDVSGRSIVSASAEPGATQVLAELFANEERRRPAEIRNIFDRYMAKAKAEDAATSVRTKEELLRQSIAEADAEREFREGTGAEGAEKRPAVRGSKRWEALTPSMDRPVRVKGHYEVVDLDALTFVDISDKAVQEEQDRNRRGARTETQVYLMRKNFTAERLEDDRHTDRGAPIYRRLPDGTLRSISGEGRTRLLRSVYEFGGDNEAAYRDAVKRFAEERGITIGDDVKRPVLVRVVDDFGGLTAAELAKQSNADMKNLYSESEQAHADARVIKKILPKLTIRSSDKLAGADAEAAETFVKAFLEETGAATQYQQDNRSYYKETLATRIQNALTAYFVNDRDAATALFDSPITLGNTLEALRALAVDLVRLKANEEMDLSREIGAALKAAIYIRDQKQKGNKGTTLVDAYFEQNAIPGIAEDARKGLDLDAAKRLTDMMLDTRKRTLIKVLRAYLSEVEHTSGIDGREQALFGSLEGETDYGKKSAALKRAYDAVLSGRVVAEQRAFQKEQTRRAEAGDQQLLADLAKNFIGGVKVRIVNDVREALAARNEAAEVRRRLGGYMGKAWSARANDALERGLRPAPMVAKELGVSSEAVELHMRSPEWHHVGDDYEEVHFYDPDEAPLTDADAVNDAETARSFLRYVEMLNYDTRTFTVKPRVAGRFESEASDEAYALFTSRGTAVAKEAFEAEDEFRALVEKETASAEELRAAAKATLAAAKSGRKKMEAAAKAFLSEHKDWKRERPRRARRGANGLRYSLEEAFPATEAERAEIERAAKARGTWLKAPNGQDTKLTPKQWVTVRTAAFKKWFGDWEKDARIEKLRRSEPLVFTGEEYKGKYELDARSAERYILDNLRGEYVNKDTGERISVSRRGVRKVLHHDVENEVHLKSIAYIPQMLENAVFVSEELNAKSTTGFDSYRYYVCGLEIGGEQYTAKLVVGKLGRETYYDHVLSPIKKDTLLKGIGEIPSPRAQKKSISTEIRDKRLLSILQTNSSKIVDENGEPLVVYHGTGASFTAFDKGKIGSSTNNKGIFGNGFYMTEDSSYASYYNRSDGRINKDGRGNVMPLFVSLKNPFDWSAPDAVRVAEAAGFPKSRTKGTKLLPLTEEKQILSFTENLKKSGHDGVVFTFDDGTREFVAFEPEQIKSATENVGTFDAGNPDIRYSLGGGTSTIRAWHGSPHAFAAEEGAPFGRFGLSFVGTGEGAQAFGYGIYLTSEEDIARHNYAQRLGDDDVAAAQRALGRFGLAWATFRADELAACVSFSDFKRELRAAAWSLEDLVEEGEMTAEELASDKASIREATKTREAFDALLSAMLATQDYFYESRREDIERALEEAGDGRKAKALREELERFDELKREADANERPRHHLYEARIRVADDASNLLDWVARPSEEQLERIRAGLRERGVSEEAAVRLTEPGSFGEIYRGISEELGGAAKASETLKAAGFAGHKYPADSVGTGAADYSRGTNYVIYDTGATEITDAVRWSLGAAEQAAWGKVLDDYEAGRLPSRGMVTVLNRTPAVLQRCGAANLPLKISKGVLDKVTKEKHGVPVRELRGLLVNLDNPIAVFRSRTQADSLVVLTELRDEANGNNAVVAVRLDAKSDSEHEINAVASIYGRPAFQIEGFLRDGLALYLHTKKIRAYLRSGRLQLPAETSRRGSSSLLTQDDFTQDELGVVKVNNKKPLDGRGEVYGAYDPRTREVFVAENARVDTLLHELGWHAAYDWARTHEPKLYAQMRSYAQSAPEEVRAAVRETYVGFSEEAMLDEIGAAAFSEEFTGLVEERLAEIKDGRRRGIVKRWWAGFKKLAVRLWRALTGREETPHEAMKRLAETFVEGKQLGSWSGKSVEVHRSATREQRVMDERDAEERESQKRAREKARAPKRNKGPMRERLVRRNADKLAAGMLRYGLRFTETPEGEQRERQYGEDEDLAPTVARLFFKSASDEELASIVETARQEASAILRKMGATEKGLGVSYAEAKKLVDAERALDIGGGMREALGTYAEANEDAAAFGAAETRRARRETQWKTGRIGARKLSREEQAQLGIPVFDGVATPAWAENAARAIAKAYEHPSATGVARETLAGELRVAARHLPNSAATERAYREVDRIKGAGNLAEIINHANTAERIISQGWNKASFEEVRSALERTLAPFARFTPRKAEKDRRTAGMTEIFLNACRKAQDMSADEVATEIEKLSAFIDKATPEMFDDPHTLALVQQRQAYALFTRYENAVKRKDASALQDILSAIESRRAEGDVELARRIEKQKREAQDISAILANATKVKGRNKAQRVSATGALLEKVGTLFMGSLTLKQLVEDGFRFCKDEKLRAAAQHEIDKLNGEIARANQERTLLENESRVWLCKKTVEIFGGKKTGAKNRGVEATAKEATAIMLELSVPRKEYAKFSRDGETPLSYAQILAQYAMIRQADVLEPVRDVENEDALDVSGRSLCARVAKFDELRQAVGPRGIAFIDALSEHYMSEGEAIDKVAMDVAGVPVTLRQADYSPIVRDISENNPNKAHDAPLSYVPAVMTPRVPNLRDINENVDIFSVFVRRAQDTSHFRAFGRMHLKLARIFSDKAYSDAYNKTEGTTRAQQLVNIVRDVLSSKLPSSPKDSPEQFLGMVVSTTAKIALGGNALVALRQPTSITSYAHDVGWAKTFKAMMSIGTDLSGAIERMNAIRKSPEWFSRYGTEELRIQLDALNVSNPKLWWRRFMSLYMAANRWGDKVPILLIGQGIYGATLQTLRNSVNPQTGKVYTEEEAKKAAMAAVWDATEKTQMASSPANMSVWQRSGSTAVRMLAQFQSSTNLFLSAEVKAFRDLSANPRSAKAWRQFASVMFNNHVVIPGMFELVGLIFRNLIWGDDDDDEFFSEEDLRDLAIAMLLGPASGVWFLGSALTGLLTSQSYSGMTTPVFSMVNRLARSSKKVASAASEGDTDELLEALDDMGKIFAPYRDIRRFYDNYIGDDS